MKNMITKMNSMKSPIDLMSPLSWIILIVTFCSNYALFLKPTFLELILFIVLDTCVIMLTVPLYYMAIKRAYPSFSNLFNKNYESFLSTLSDSEKKNEIESFYEFPRVVAITGYFFSVFKAIPSALFITYYWKHTISNSQQMLLFFLVCAFNQTFTAAATYFDLHAYFTELLKKTKNLNLPYEVFTRIKIKNRESTFVNIQYTSLMFIGFFATAMTLSVVKIFGHEDFQTLTILVGAIFLSVLVMQFRLWYLSNKLLYSGLNYTLELIEKLGTERDAESPRLMTIPILNKAVILYLDLVARLKKNENEVKEMVLTQAERSRYEVVGEMAALVAHDLSSPLTAASFYAETLTDGLDKLNSEQQTRYTDELSKNINRSIDLVKSIKAKFKNLEKTEHCIFDAANNKVLLVLKTQYRKEIKSFSKIVFSIAPELAQLSLKTSEMDLIHVLDNLYRNSVQNLIKSEVDSPCIRVSLYSLSSKSARILFEDNGTGLSRSMFETFLNGKSMGLKLTKKLIELNGGRMDLIEAMGKSGTTFMLTLPISQPEVTIESSQLLQGRGLNHDEPVS